jgi:hypothetical protein
VGTVVAVMLVAFVVIFQLLKRAGAEMRNRQPTRPRDPTAAPETMAELWQEMRAQLDAARAQQEGQARLPAPPRSTGSMARPATPKRLPVPTARFPVPVAVERGGSIEVASREVAPRVVDQDDGAEALVQRRIDAAAARNGEWQLSDHDRFDAKIRTVAAAVPVERRRHRLREAMIWREVLAPPVSLRDIDDR